MLLALFGGSQHARSQATGLMGEYFDGQNFERKIMFRNDPKIDFHWHPDHPPADGMSPANYSIRWTGQLTAPETGLFKFSAIVDDGLRVWVGGKNVIDAWQLNDDVPFRGSMHLEAGKTYELRVEYFNGLLEGDIVLQWLLPSRQSSWGSWLDGKFETIEARHFSQKTPPAPPPVAAPKIPKKEKPATPPAKKPVAAKSKKQDTPPVETPATTPETTEKALAKTDSLQAFVPKNIQFVKSKAVILPESFAELDRLVEMLKRHPDLKIKIEGHTDGVGNATLNMELSKQRAQKVANYLVKKGVAVERLRAFGFGDSHPLDSSGSAAGRALNRRVEFILLKDF